MLKLKQELSEEQLNRVASVAKSTGLSLDMCKILCLRGIDDENKVNKFLTAGKKYFLDAYKLKDVKEAVERIKLAKANNENVLIFGDYDADGICATTVMRNGLKDFGITATTYVPERDEGYGLKIETLKMLIERDNPQLVITVDCGIGAVKEVDYLHENGIDVIVTDHHEISDSVPSGIVINCRFKNQEYEFDSLCGAGVAYKLIYALIGERANAYLDLVTIATIADSMPLISENRDIVSEGLRQMNDGVMSLAVKKLFETNKGNDITSTSIAYNLAPKINAAGRMGSVKTALELFLTDDEDKMNELCQSLVEFNQKRQTECEELYKTAKNELSKKENNHKIILLKIEGFSGGLTGIVSAKLVEEFSRPAIIFVLNGDGLLKGSARSIESVNVFDAIYNCKDVIEEFGGHAQAAGVSVKPEKFDEFERRINEYLDKTYGYTEFIGKTETDGEITDEIDVEFAKELTLLEPCGTGNKKPIFTSYIQETTVSPLKIGSPHLLIKSGDLSFIYFYGESKFASIRNNAKKRVIYETSLSTYNGVTSVKGVVKEIHTETEESEVLDLMIYKQNLFNLTGEKANYEKVTTSGVKELIKKFTQNVYETLFVVQNVKTLENFEELKDYSVNLFAPEKRNLMNVVLLGINGDNIEGYKRIVYLDKPFAVIGLQGQKVYVNEEIEYEKGDFADVRERVKKAYNYVKNESKFLRDSLDIVKYPYEDNKCFVLATEILLELGIFSLRNGFLQIDELVKNPLENSKIFQFFTK